MNRLLLPILFLVSCVAAKVDPLALFEPAQLAWPEVAKDYQRGIEDGVADLELIPEAAAALAADGVRMEEALDQKSRTKLATVPWDAMAPWADRGIQDKIDDGDIGLGVAVSRREQLVQFTEAIHRLQGR